MERRGRASDCQRSYDFTQNDLPPPLTGAGRARHPRPVQSGRTFGAAVLLLGPRWRCLPLSRLRRRDPPQVAYSTRAFSAQAVSIRGASHTLGSFPWTGYEALVACGGTLRARFAVLEVIQGAPPRPPSRPDAFHVRSICGDSIQPRDDGAIWTNSID
jgi:hypothetical protein